MRAVEIFSGLPLPLPVAGSSPDLPRVVRAVLAAASTAEPELDRAAERVGSTISAERRTRFAAGLSPRRRLAIASCRHGVVQQAAWVLSPAETRRGLIGSPQTEQTGPTVASVAGVTDVTAS